MKKFKILFIVILFIFIIYNFRLEKIGRENIELSKNIKLGMTINQVDRIMKNKPFKKYECDIETDELVFLYESAFSSSGDVKITFDKNDSIVRRVYRGE
jgi:hypothetical protein